jgi:hypothetical protein
MATVRLTEEGIPLGTVFITGGPSKYDFLVAGLHTIGGGDYAGQHEFKLTYGDYLEKQVNIRVTGVRQMPAWLCPFLPGFSDDRQHNLVWSEAWEFDGYCPGHGVPVRGIYSPMSRKGLAFLWQAHVDDYGCAGCKHDLHVFFANHDNNTAMLALGRAMGHMVRGSAVGGYHVDCPQCWDLFQQLRRTCELP